MRSVAIIPLALILWTGETAGQTITNAPANTNSPAVVVDEKANEAWSFSASVYTYIVPDSDTYAQPTVTADHGWLHLEARYNYEALETGSVWVGCNFGGGEKVTWDFTPMLGGVFGDTTGIAPGYKGSVSWWWLALYSEGEYVFNTGDSSESFFYNWSELTLSPVDWFRLGVVTQRTKVYETDRDVQRGLLVGCTFKKVDLATYVFNPDESDPTVVVAVGFSF